MHVHSKRKELKPSFFAHAFSFGLSVQRLERSNEKELVQLVDGFLAPAEDRVWLGYVECSCDHLRSMRVEPDKRLFCVYDAAEECNPAHAEIGVSHRISEADQIEYRRELMRVFGDGVIRSRHTLHEGGVLAQLSEDVRARPLPQQWLE